MTYYPTLDEDLARAKAILAKGKADLDATRFERAADMLNRVEAASLTGGTIYGGDIYAAYKLLESFVAALEDRKCHVFRPDHNGECTGCDGWADAHSPEAIALGGELANLYSNAAAAKREIERLARCHVYRPNPEGQCTSCGEVLGAHSPGAAGVGGELDGLRRRVEELEEGLRTVLIGKVALRAELAQFYGLFSDYEEPCTSFEQAQAIWNEMGRRRGIEADEQARLRQVIHETAHGILDTTTELQATIERERRDAAAIREERDRLRALVAAVGEKVCELALRHQRWAGEAGSD